MVASSHKTTHSSPDISVDDKNKINRSKTINVIIVLLALAAVAVFIVPIFDIADNTANDLGEIEDEATGLIKAIPDDIIYAFDVIGDVLVDGLDWVEGLFGIGPHMSELPKCSVCSRVYIASWIGYNRELKCTVNTNYIYSTNGNVSSSSNVCDNRYTSARYVGDQASPVVVFNQPILACDGILRRVEYGRPSASDSKSVLINMYTWRTALNQIGIRGNAFYHTPIYSPILPCCSTFTTFAFVNLISKGFQNFCAPTLPQDQTGPDGTSSTAFQGTCAITPTCQTFHPDPKFFGIRHNLNNEVVIYPNQVTCDLPLGVSRIYHGYAIDALNGTRLTYPLY